MAMGFLTAQPVTENFSEEKKSLWSAAALLQLKKAVFLTKYASHVTILIRRDDFSCAEAVAEAAKRHPKITVLTNTEVVYVEGDHALRKICYKNKQYRRRNQYLILQDNDTFGVFVFAGYEPNTDLVKDTG